MTLNQYMKMSKAALIRKITKQLRTMPKAKLARLCYTMTKAKLPRLKRVRKAIRQKKKRKFSRKQLAAQRLFAKRSRAGTLRR